jgi:uncharacterized protein
MEFESLTFENTGTNLKVNLYGIFHFEIPGDELKSIGEYELDNNQNNKILFREISEKKANNKFNNLIAKYVSNLKTRIQDKKAIYLHKNSNIPLIGLPFIGLIDRNTTCIELKPITGCNIGCTFCSVNEGIGSNKEIDFVVEKDYLIEELKLLIAIKAQNNPDHTFEVCINAHGEPTLYQPMEELIQDISKIAKIKTISLITNLTLLNEQKIDNFIKAGLTKFNLSINALNPELAKRLANFPINIERIKQLTKYIANRSEITIAPVLMKGVNEKAIEDIVIFANTLNTKYNIKIAAQNFLEYRGGRNPVNQMPWDEFKSFLSNLETKHQVKLLFNLDTDFDIYRTKSLQKPLKKGDIIKALVVSNGRYNSDKIAVYGNRSILLPNTDIALNNKVRIKITSDKHNIFYGTLIC